MEFDLRQLEIFAKVVELGSFSKAAKAVYLAQASVSERIANLEAAVGTRLLDRLGRKVTPTNAGEILYKHALLLLDMRESARQEMESFLGIRGGEITVGGSTIPGEYILPGLIGGFTKKYPKVKVHLRIGDSHSIEAAVQEGRLELGVMGFRSRLRTLVVHDLWSDELVIVAPAGHPWADRHEIDPEELAEVPFLMRERGSGTLRIFEDYLQKTPLKGLESLRVAASLGSSTAVKEAVKGGVGVSVISSRAIQAELETGSLRALRIRGLRIQRRFYLVRDRRRFASPLCQALGEFLLQTRDPLPPPPEPP